MAATPTSTSCWGCFRWRQLQQEGSSPATTLDNRRPTPPQAPVTQTPASSAAVPNRFSYPTGIERHLARIHNGTTADNRKSFPPCQASDSDSGLGRTITAETSEESFAGAAAMVGGPRATGAVRAFDEDGGLAQEMALLRVELEIVRWECDSIIRQKRREGSWSRRRRVLDWMQRHDSSDTSYDPSTVSSTSSALRPSSPSPSSSVEALCRSPTPSFRDSDSPSRPSYVRSQSMNMSACPPDAAARDRKRCSSASPVRRKALPPSVASPIRSYRLSCTINDDLSPSQFRPRCRSNPVPGISAPTPSSAPLPASRTAGDISELCRRPRGYEKQQSCFPTQSIPESPVQLGRQTSRTLMSIPQEEEDEEPLEEPRRWFGDLSADVCAFHSPQRIRSPGRLLPVFEAECYGGGNIDVDFELVTAEYEVSPRNSKGAVSKKSRKQMRRERAMQIARSRADTTTSTDSDATLKSHGGGCQACRARRRPSTASPSKRTTFNQAS